ncbi:hypothetical protein [Bradyrhizobium sp. CCBAU 51753]|uniref:hypothetical protein n=1 Tax=Bradyrhizobium sp. CCBAU 51753 TaxID=1325100 RepID=UPI00188DB02D|nr:hypothetical protein [Bradyrhizobium sp. CCBAU 51753]QOZ22493.1 hypothetical protein XH93_01625 [Bradyrhizobium sp. CCBAU 51753]
MASISSHPDSIERRRASIDGPANLLVFSCAGLLIDVLALLLQGAAHSASLSFALIAGAAPVAAMVMSWLADRADAGGPERE